jgi:hypothetical protein
MDDQQVGHARLQLFQLVQQDAQDALLLAQEVDGVAIDNTVHFGLLNTDAGHFDIEGQVDAVGDGEIGAAPFGAGVGLVGQAQAAIIEQAVSCLQLAAQVQDALRGAGDADLLANLIPVGLDEGGEARGGYPTDAPSSFDLSTATPVADAGTATVEAQSTRVALGPLLKQEQAWPVKLAESFKDNSNGWDTGDERDSYISGNRSIGNGLYSWNMTAVQGTSDFSYPIMLDDQTDFYTSVDMKYEAMPNDPDADAGLVFRYSNADQTWYYFSLNNEGQYYFGWYDGTSWDQLIPETSTSAFHAGQINQLAVGASGAQFIFLINGQMVDEFVNDVLSSGTIGVGVNLPQAGERAKVQFSNLRVLSPVTTPASDANRANGGG